MLAKLISGLPNKWLVKNSINGRIFINLIFVSVCVGVGKLIGAGKEVALAYRFGASEPIDIYVYVLVLILLLPGVWASVSNSVLVPLMAKLSNAKRREFNGELSGSLVLVGGLLVLVSMVVVPIMLTNMPSQFTSEGKHFGIALSRWLSTTIFISLFICQCNAILTAEERHINVLFDSVPALTLLVAILAFPDFEVGAVLIGGTVLGAVLHLFLLVILLVRTKSLPFPSFRFVSTAWPVFRNAIGVMVLSSCIIGLGPIIDQIYASQLIEGSISTLNYSNRLLALFLGLGATAIARSMLPILSKQDVSSGKYLIAVRWFYILALGGLVIAAAVFLLSPTMVRLLFERGAFETSNTVQVASVLRYSALQIPFYFSGIVLAQYFASIGSYRVLLFSSVLAIVVKTSLIHIFIGRLGVNGIALSTSLMYFATFLFLLVATLKTRDL